VTAPERDLALDRAVDLGDLDELLREIDRRCERRDWDGLVRLRDRSRAAVERGRQLWPAAAHAEYRLALEAPGPWAAAVLVEGAGRFTLGPLAEVAASSHAWSELRPHLSPGPLATVCGHERVVRGDDLTGDALLDPAVLDLPAALAPWEPAYPVAAYRAATADFPSPDLPPPAPVSLPAPGTALEDLAACDALVELARAWTAESNGRAEAACVAGPATSAVAGLGPPRARMAEISPAQAMAAMAWTAASGGAHGRRRGMATGRFGAWWAAAALCGMVDDWPIDQRDLGDAVAELRWWVWDADEPITGWALHLAVEDPADGLAWAVAATDAT
jgi:hypothetical protein